MREDPSALAPAEDGERAHLAASVASASAPIGAAAVSGEQPAEPATPEQSRMSIDTPGASSSTADTSATGTATETPADDGDDDARTLVSAPTLCERSTADAHAAAPPTAQAPDQVPDQRGQRSVFEDDEPPPYWQAEGAWSSMSVDEKVPMSSSTSAATTVPELVVSEPAAAHPPRLPFRARDHGQAYLTCKLVAVDSNKSGMTGGVWHEHPLELRIDDPPGPAQGYQPLGAEIEVDGEGHWLSSSSTASTQTDDLSTPSSTTASSTSRNRRIRIISREELDNVKPHKDAFFHPLTCSWTIFTCIAEGRKGPRGEDDKYPLWEHRGQCISPTSATLRMKPPLGLGEDGEPDSLEALEPVHLAHDISTGRQVVYSDLDWYPAVIPSDLATAFQQLKYQNPAPGESRELSAYMGWSALWKALDNHLFKGETRAIPVTGKTFSRQLGWSALVQEIFKRLGATFVVQADGSVDSVQLPALRADSPDRERLLRCWVEISLLLDHRRKEYGDNVPEHRKQGSLRVRPIQLRSRLVEIAGGDQLHRVTSNERSSEFGEVREDAAYQNYHQLGVMPLLRSDVIAWTYRRQKERSPELANIYFDHVEQVFRHRARHNVHDFESQLETLIVTERSSGMISSADVVAAHGVLQTNDAVNDEEIGEAYTFAAELAGSDRDKLLEARHALEVLGKVRGSEWIHMILESTAAMAAEKTKMSIDEAMRTLEVPPGSEAPDEILTALVAHAEGPAAAKMREALEVIGEHRNSQYLVNYARHGADYAAQQQMAAPVDWPVGLTNIANTCYLNSLLQYFFSIRELRECILGFSDVRSEDDREMRVGGRVVSRKEVARSKRFVLQLQSLFRQLIVSKDRAVTPETELAYLALVPSKEDLAAESTEDERSPAQRDSMVVDEPTPVDASATTDVNMHEGDSPKSPTVLGKRSVDHLETENVDVEMRTSPRPEQQQQQQQQQSAEPTSTSSPKRTQTEESESTTTTTTKAPSRRAPQAHTEMRVEEASDGVTEIRPATDNDNAAAPPAPATAPPGDLPRPDGPPPLPPRPAGRTRRQTLEHQVESYMSFGRQNDVTECMDNVMFQVEVALRHNARGAEQGGGGGGGGGDEEQDSDSSSEERHSSLIKRLFYGEMKQKLELEDPAAAERLRVKTEPFSYLLIDVSQEGRTIYDGLDANFDISTVEIEGKRASRQISLVSVPTILQVQLQRVQYDRVHMRPYKSNAYLAFSRTLALDRYVEPAPDDTEAQRRQQRTLECRIKLDELRARLAQLSAGKEHPPAILRQLAPYLRKRSAFLVLPQQQQPEDGSSFDGKAVAAAIEASAKKLEALLNGLRAEIRALESEVATIWDGAEKHVYELVSVFMHRGTALSGHYFVFQRNSKDPAQWLRYNDSVVSAAADAESDVFGRAGGGSLGDQNPYFLAYVRRDCLDAIETVKRDPLPSSSPS